MAYFSKAEFNSFPTKPSSKFDHFPMFLMLPALLTLWSIESSNFGLIFFDQLITAGRY